MNEIDRKRLEYRPNLRMDDRVLETVVESVSPLLPAPNLNENPTESNAYIEPDVQLPGYNPIGSEPKLQRRQKSIAVKAGTKQSSTRENGNTQYTSSIPVVTNKSSQIMISPQQPDLTNAVKAYRRYNPAESMKQAKNVCDETGKVRKKIEEYLMQNTKFADYPQAMADNDNSLIDKYQVMAENIDGDIYAEIYPVICAMQKDIQDLMDGVNTSEFDGKIDWFNIDKVIQDETAKRDTIAKAEVDGKPVNYKQIAMAAQIGKFVEDRVNLLDEMLTDILKTSSSSPVILPHDTDLVKDYYDDVKELCQQDMRKMMSFQATGIINDLIQRVAELKPKVLKNRQFLANADQEQFFAALPLVRAAEDKFNMAMVDLYKSQILDEIYRGDYINTLREKNGIRETYGE